MDQLTLNWRRLGGKTYQDFLKTIAGNGAITLLSAIGGILVARLLGPEGRGVFAIAVVWAGIFSVISQLGMPQAITYFIAKNQDSFGDLFLAILFIFVIQNLAIIAMAWFLVGLLLGSQSPTTILTVRIYLFSIPITTLITYMSTLAQGIKNFSLFSWFRVVASLGFLFPIILAYFLDIYDPYLLVRLLLFTQGAVSFSIFLYFKFRFKERLRKRRLKKGNVIDLIRFGFKTYIGSISWMANARLDQFVMSFWLNPAQLGIYAVAVSYAGLLSPMLGAFAMILFPRVAETSLADARHFIKRAIKINLIFSTIGSVSLILLSTFLIPWFFGIEYFNSILPAAILLIGTILLGSNFVQSDALRGVNRPEATSFAELTGVVVTILALLILLPSLGIVGASIASVFSYLSTFFILFISLKKYVFTSE